MKIYIFKLKNNVIIYMIGLKEFLFIIKQKKYKEDKIIKGIFKKSTCITTALLMSLSLIAGTVNSFAEEVEEPSITNSLPSLSEYYDDGIIFSSPAEVIKKAYWADLESGKVSGWERSVNWSHNDGYDIIDNNEFSSTGVFPKYVLKPNETALKDENIDFRMPGMVKYLPSAGITETYSGYVGYDYWYLNYFYRLGYLLGDDANSGTYAGKSATDPVPAANNPFGFKETDLLSQAEIKDPTKLMVYGDIMKTGSSDSTEIGEYKQGEELKLDFIMNDSWTNRFIMGMTLDKTRGSMHSAETVQKIYNETKGKLDSQIVYTLSIPKELEARNVQVKLSGLEDFELSHQVKPVSSTENKLVMTLRLKDSLRGKPQLWKKTIERLKNLDTSKVKLSISGLFVKADARPETNVTLVGTIGGYQDWAISRVSACDVSGGPIPGTPCGSSPVAPPPPAGNVPTSSPLDNSPCPGPSDSPCPGPSDSPCPGPSDSPCPGPSDNPCPGTPDDCGPAPSLGRKVDTVYDRTYLSFVARQEPSGKDQATPGDKPRLISYTFKVKKGPENPERPNPGRIDGPDRIETAINISKKNYDKAKTVIVVRHDLFPDSMTASVLAKLKDAPILLNPTDKLDSRVGAEIKRLGAEEIIIVGGHNSISDRVREDLKAFDKDRDVERIAGVDRYGTSEMVARRVVGITGKKYTGVVASGQVFADALSVGTFASRDGYPILLVKKDSIPVQIERVIKDLEIEKTYIAGGTNTISRATEAKLPRVEERMAGKDRYETSVAIAKSKFRGSKEAYIASGEEFADALVISPISGKYNRPTLLVSRNKNNNLVVKNYIKDNRLTAVTAIGGERYIPYSVLEDLVR